MTVFTKSGTGTYTITASTSSTPNANSTYVHKVDVTGAESVGSDDYALVLKRVEGYDFVPLIGKKVTLSFWVKSTVTGVYSVSLRNEGADRSFVQEYIVNESDTWEYKVVQMNLNYSGGTWEYSTGRGLIIYWSICCGSTRQTDTIGSWLEGNYMASENQVNGASSTACNFELSQCQLELGNIATPFIEVPYAEFQETINRYYQAQSVYTHATSVATGTGNCYASWDFDTTMRANPTVSHTTAQFWQGGVGWAYSPTVVHSANTYRCLTTMAQAGASYVVGYGMLMLIAVTLDARL
jgi:hypothetical protein